MKTRKLFLGIAVLLLSVINVFSNDFSEGLKDYENKKFVSAISSFNAFLVKNPEHIKARYYRAMSFLFTAKARRAIEDLNILLESDPENIDYLHALAMAAQHVGRHEDAVICYSTIIKNDSKYYSAYAGRGISNYKLGKYQEADLDLNYALKYDLKNPEIYYYLGLVNYKKKKYAKSVEYFNKSEKLGYEEPELYYHRGNSQYFAKKFKNAIKDYTKILKIKPNHIKALNNRAMVYEKNGQMMPAEADRSLIQELKYPTKNYPPAKSLKIKKYKSKSGKFSVRLPEGWYVMEKSKGEITEMLITKDKLKNMDTPYNVGVKIVYNENTEKYYNVVNAKEIRSMMEGESSRIKEDYYRHTIHQRKETNTVPWCSLELLEVYQVRPELPYYARYQYFKSRDNKLLIALFQSHDKYFDYYQDIFKEAFNTLEVK